MLFRSLYTSDPYEPSGVIGLFRNDTEKQTIIKEYTTDILKAYPNIDINKEVNDLVEIEIPFGKCGAYY